VQSYKPGNSLSRNWVEGEKKEKRCGKGNIDHDLSPKTPEIEWGKGGGASSNEIWGLWKTKRMATARWVDLDGVLYWTWFGRLLLREIDLNSCTKIKSYIERVTSTFVNKSGLGSIQRGGGGANALAQNINRPHWWTACMTHLTGVYFGTFVVWKYSTFLSRPPPIRTPDIGWVGPRFPKSTASINMGPQLIFDNVGDGIPQTEGNNDFPHNNRSPPLKNYETEGQLQKWLIQHNNKVITWGKESLKN